MCIDLVIFVYKIFEKMRTNIEIDDDLMKKALKYSKLKTKKEIINEALTQYVKYQMRLNMLSLQGKVKWVGDLDKMRRNA
jgi:Arc/MetJ family transcription regulator